jgi:hypothetical protein
MPYSLFVSYDGLAGAGNIILDGSGMAAPVRGSHYSPGRGSRSLDAIGRQVISEEIAVELVGTYRAITDWVTNLNTRFELARAGAVHIPTSRLLLVVKESDEAGNYVWWSTILEAWLVLDPSGLGQRNGGQQLLTLRVTREDKWQSTNTVHMLLSFPVSGDQGSQGYMLNHCDAAAGPTAGHTNWGYYADNLPGDLPAKLTIQFKTSQAGLSIGDALLGCGWSDFAAPNVAYMLPTLDDPALSAGAGSTKATLVSAACSGGSYATFTWSTPAETQILQCLVPTQLYALGLSQGRPFKPVMLLQAPAAYTDLWLKIRVLAGPGFVPIYETEYILYPANSPYIEFPPLYLPPDGVQETQSLSLAIYALKTSPAPYTLAIDFLQAWPVDGGFRRYHCLSYIAGNGQILDQNLGDIYWSNNIFSQSRAVVVATGPALLAMPGKTNLFAFAHLQAGSSWVIDDQIQFLVNATPAKRNL